MSLADQRASLAEDPRSALVVVGVFRPDEAFRDVAKAVAPRYVRDFLRVWRAAELGTGAAEDRRARGRQTSFTQSLPAPPVRTPHRPRPSAKARAFPRQASGVFSPRHAFRVARGRRPFVRPIKESAMTTIGTDAPKSNRGFASLDTNKRREIASNGGKAAHAQGLAHEFTVEDRKSVV